MKMPFRYGCVVDGEYFCPRPELERQLRNYAESGQNLVIQGERRMGKTSLVKKAISGMKGERLLYIDRLACLHCHNSIGGMGGRRCRDVDGIYLGVVDELQSIGVPTRNVVSLCIR